MKNSLQLLLVVKRPHSLRTNGILPVGAWSGVTWIEISQRERTLRVLT